ncbi:hypothetical protein O6H91_20G017900 [Diphasiastrum complanatum]|uniref:Uncharacterized protein n=1 Tax=Diphasiastrum complanatum TaxID=34168 RepID=A0ACC2APV5_DIPCM|nr:hypothetical protein O6H91_20G017900 [Diphasiastrum complanatum]
MSKTVECFCLLCSRLHVKIVAFISLHKPWHAIVNSCFVYETMFGNDDLVVKRKRGSIRVWSAINLQYLLPPNLSPSSLEFTLLGSSQPLLPQLGCFAEFSLFLLLNLVLPTFSVVSLVHNCKICPH